jgi:predicted dithiol-disulfide oxidoreductase (DUF899 family)
VNSIEPAMSGLFEMLFNRRWPKGLKSNWRANENPLEDADVPAFNVRRDGPIRHFWSSEMGALTADPGQDPRGAPALMPLSTILDTA